MAAIGSRLSRTDEMRQVVFPGAFRPRSDTWMLADAACRQPLRPGAAILELCAGPGLAGIAAARSHGAKLTTVDVSRRAALNARVNGWLNGIGVRALRGDLFDAVGAERFDLVIANPPYVPGHRRRSEARRARRTPAQTGARSWTGSAPTSRITSWRAACSWSCTPRSAAATTTRAALEAFGMEVDIADRAQGPLGPILRARRSELEARGQLKPTSSSKK